MTSEQVSRLYNARYALEYDDKFLHSELAKPDSIFEAEILTNLLRGGGPWLDIACGTGYFLSRFPGVERAGLDISPAMLRVAAARNPGVALFHQDFRQQMTEWHNRWALVSCMWYAYSLVSSMDEIGLVVENLAAWTAPEGVCFVPLCDPKLVAGVPIPYEVVGTPWPGRVMITGVTWSYLEGEGSRHEDMVAPQVPHILSLFGRHFSQLDQVVYPSGRTALLARKKYGPHTN